MRSSNQKQLLAQLQIKSRANFGGTSRWEPQNQWKMLINVNLPALITGLLEIHLYDLNK